MKRNTAVDLSQAEPMALAEIPRSFYGELWGKHGSDLSASTTGENTRWTTATTVSDRVRRNGYNQGHCFFCSKQLLRGKVPPLQPEGSSNVQRN